MFRLDEKDNILVKAFKIYINHFSKMLFIAALVYIPIYTVIYLLPAQAFLEAEDLNGYAMLMLASYMVFLFFSPLAVMGNAFIAKESVEGRNPPLIRVLEAIFSHLGTVLYATLLFVSVIFTFSILSVFWILGLIFFPLMLYYVVSFSLYSHAIVLRNKKAMFSLIYSRLIVKGNWLKVLALLICSGASVFMMTGVLYDGFEGMATNPVASVLLMALPSALNGYFDMLLTLLFLDIEKKKGIVEL